MARRMRRGPTQIRFEVTPALRIRGPDRPLARVIREGPFTDIARAVATIPQGQTRLHPTGGPLTGSAPGTLFRDHVIRFFRGRNSLPRSLEALYRAKIRGPDGRPHRLFSVQEAARGMASFRRFVDQRRGRRQEEAE